MSKNKNFGVNVFTEGGKKWSARAEEFQLAKGNAITLRSRAKKQLAQLQAGLDSLDNRKGSVHEAEIPAMRETYTAQMTAVQSALKESLEAEAAFEWSKSEKAWAKTMLSTSGETARCVAIRGFYASEYGMDVSIEWAKSILAALGLDRLGVASNRQFTKSGYADANKATVNSVLTAYMVWNVRQCRENGLKKYMFADDIVDMYKTKREREEKSAK